MALKIELGDKFYLFRHGNNPKIDPAEDHLLITAHGGYADALGPLKGTGNVKVPDWCQLYYYASHGSTLSDPGLSDIMRGKYQVKEVKASGVSVHNYELSKFQGKHGGGEIENYAAISKCIDYASNKAVNPKYVSPGKMGLPASSHSNFAFKFDVLTVRNRKFKSDPSLSDVFAALKQHGYRYENIHCSFCRSNMRPFTKSSSQSAQQWGAH
ncbi:MAG: putative adhesin [Paracoccaceae bacterium]